MNSGRSVFIESESDVCKERSATSRQTTSQTLPLCALKRLYSRRTAIRSCPDPSRSLTSTSSGGRRLPLVVLRLHHSVDIVSTTNTIGVFLVNEVIISALIGAAATIIVGVLVQRMRNNQKNKNYLRDKYGDQLQSLASSITTMCNHLDKALDPWDKTEINFQVIHDCYEELKRCQSSVYIIGKRDLTRSFNDLFNSLDYIEIYSSDDVWYLNVRIECEKLPSLSGNLLREISSIQGY